MTTGNAFARESVVLEVGIPGVRVAKRAQHVERQRENTVPM